MTPNIIAAIVTLVVGLAIVVISFFIGDGKKENETDGTLAAGRSLRNSSMNIVIFL